MDTPANPNATARIVWLSPADGGRRSGPPESRYIAPTRFDVPDERWPDEAWSLTAVMQSVTGLEWTARVSFVAPDAPPDRLRSGNSFGLYEGARLVARGVIL